MHDNRREPFQGTSDHQLTPERHPFFRHQMGVVGDQQAHSSTDNLTDGTSFLIAIGNAHVRHVLLRQHQKIGIIRHHDALLWFDMISLVVLVYKSLTVLHALRTPREVTPQGVNLKRRVA